VEASAGDDHAAVVAAEEAMAQDLYEAQADARDDAVQAEATEIGYTPNAEEKSTKMRILQAAKAAAEAKASAQQADSHHALVNAQSNAIASLPKSPEKAPL